MKAAVALTLTGLLAVPGTAAVDPTHVSSEDYGFLSVMDDRCIPKIGEELAAERKAECERMTGPHRYRGTWVLAYETSIFEPAGRRSCVEGATLDYCPDLVLEGAVLPSAELSGCARMYEVDFVGRRSVHPRSDLNYRLVVDQLISLKRLPDPAGGDECGSDRR